MTFLPHRPCKKPGCSALVGVGAGTYCEAHRTVARAEVAVRDRHRGTAAARGYDAEWQRARIAFLAQYPLCAGVLMATQLWTRDLAIEFHAERERRRELGELLWLQAYTLHLTPYTYLPWDVTKPATVVDHIIPHKGDHELMWAPWNWQALTKRAHDRKTASEKALAVDGARQRGDGASPEAGSEAERVSLTGRPPGGQGNNWQPLTKRAHDRKTATEQGARSREQGVGL